jgi:hypothetical protein
MAPQLQPPAPEQFATITVVDGSTYYPPGSSLRPRGYSRQHAQQREFDREEFHQLATAGRDAAITSHYTKSDKYKQGLRTREPEFSGHAHYFVAFTISFYACLRRKGLPHLLEPFAASAFGQVPDLIGELQDSDKEIYNMMTTCLAKGPRCQKILKRYALARSAHMVWRDLFTEYLPDCENTRTALHTELHNLIWDPRTEIVSQFFDRAENIQTRILEHQGTCSPQELLNSVKAALLHHQDYRTFVFTLPATCDSLDKLRVTFRSIFALKGALTARLARRDTHGQRPVGNNGGGYRNGQHNHLVTTVVATTMDRTQLSRHRNTQTQGAVTIPGATSATNASV